VSIFDGLEIEKAEPYEGYDFSKPSRAVVAAGSLQSALLWHVGGWLAAEVEAVGEHAEDLGLDDRNVPGVWVWEGKYAALDREGNTQPEGEWRAPTDDEWAAIRAGLCPWNDEDWKLPAKKEET
jgi:hypothetical protein